MRFVILSICCLIGTSVCAQENQWVEFESIGFDRYNHPLVKVTVDGKQYYYHPQSGALVDDTEDQAADMTVVMKNGRYGVIRADGNLVVPAEYDEVSLENDYYGQWYEGIPYHYKYIKLRKNSRYGLADEGGRIIVPPTYAEIDVLNRQFIAFKEDNLWGWIDPQSGSVVQPPIYDEIRSFFHHEYAVVVKGDKRGLVAKDGTIVIPTEHTGYLRYVHSKDGMFVWGNRVSSEPSEETDVLYDLAGNIRLTGFSGLGTIYEASFLTFEKDGRTGAVNPLTGDVVIEPIYDRIEDGVRGRFKVRKDGLYGVLDESGNEVVPVAFSNLDFIDPDNRTKGSAMRGIDASAGPPLPQDEWQVALRNYRDFMDSQTYFIRVEHNGGCGLFDWKGGMLASPEAYSAIQLTFHKTPYIIARHKESEYVTILDTEGGKKEEIPHVQGDNYQYNKAAIAQNWEIGNRFVPFIKPSTDNSYTDQIGLYDLEKMKVALPMTQQYIEWLDGEYFKVRDIDNDKVNLYSKDGELVVSFGAPVDDLFVVDNRRVLLRDDQVYRLADMDGNILYGNPQWGAGGNFRARLFPEPGGMRTGIFRYGLLKLYLWEGNVFVNERGEEVRFAGYDQVDEFYTGTALAAVKTADESNYQGYSYRYGLIDREGNEIHPMSWESVSDFRGNPDWLTVMKDGKQGVVDRRGNYILEPVYDYIGTLGDAHNFEITRDGKLGLVARDGSIILEPRYERFHRNYEGKDKTWPLIAQEGDWYVMLDENGRYLPIRARRYTY